MTKSDEPPNLGPSEIPWTSVDSDNLKNGRRMIYAGFRLLMALGFEEGHVPTLPADADTFLVRNCILETVTHY